MYIYIYIYIHIHTFTKTEKQRVNLLSQKVGFRLILSRTVYIAYYNIVNYENSAWLSVSSVDDRDTKLGFRGETCCGVY